MVGSCGVPNHVSGGAVGGDAEAADAAAEPPALGLADAADVRASSLALGAGEFVATIEGAGGGADS